MRLFSRRDLIKSTLQVSASGVLYSGFASPAHKASKIATVGWVWEGQGLNAPIAPSVYGVGEGAKYFGLRKVIYMYHPNSETALEKLHDLEEVVCDITKWISTSCGYDCVQLHYDQARMPEVGQRRPIGEASALGKLSLAFPNITGGFFDSALSNQNSTSGNISPQDVASIHAALKQTNPRLKLWAWVCNDQLSGQQWAEFNPYMDVISLWVTDSRELSNLDRHVGRCRELFPGKPLVLGCYLWDFQNRCPLPLELLNLQWRRVLKYVTDKEIDGYVIFGTYLIDSAQEQAGWVRDFIAAN